MNDREALAAALDNRYEIDREIGRGGMATVYLARDVRHNRPVAIKVLDRDLGAVLGVERFLSEIRVTAMLQHPNILPLFDSGEADGLLYYVMPYVDGDSLRARLEREAQLPVDEAIRIATAIAHAADYAHAHGIVHRDLKPENILLQSGQPIVMDFGIALAVSNAGGGRLTQTGISLGSPQYMSPEQIAAERNLDARSDIYAIGTITYEMLVGDPPHTGSTAQAVMARVVADPPRSIRATRPAVPEHVDAAIARALEKIPADRFSRAQDFADALRDPASATMRNAGNRRRRTQVVPVVVAVVASLVAIGAVAGNWRSKNVSSATEARFTISPPAGVIFNRNDGKLLTFSPDGHTLAFGTSSGDIYLRRLDRLQPVLITDVNAQAPELHFSDDGKWMAYWSHGPHKIAIGPEDVGAKPTEVIGLPSLGTIVSFSSELVYLFGDSISSIPAIGGSPRVLARLDESADARWQRPIPVGDGMTLLLTVAPKGGTAADERVAVLSLSDGKRSLTDIRSNGVVAYQDGILVYTQTGRLMALPFDARSGKATGQPVQMISDVIINANAATMSKDGTLAYIAQEVPLSRIEIVDEAGDVTATLPDERRFRRPAISPDGQRIAVSVRDQDQSNLWVFDFHTRQLTRLGRNPAPNPLWTPDGRRIAFLSKNRAFWLAADGSGTEDTMPGVYGAGPIGQLVLPRAGAFAVAMGAYQSPTPNMAFPAGGGAPFPILTDADAPRGVDVSPNGKWIAYQSRETGRPEVFVRPFPTGAGKLQVSTESGGDPLWSRDGRKIYYRKGKKFVMSTLDVSGAIPRVIGSGALFSKRNLDESPINDVSVHPDGKHLVVTHPTNDGATLVVVTNWLNEVKSKLGRN